MIRRPKSTTISSDIRNMLYMGPFVAPTTWGLIGNLANTNSSPPNCGTTLGLEEVGQVPTTYVRVSVLSALKISKVEEEGSSRLAFNKWALLTEKTKIETALFQLTKTQ